MKRQKVQALVLGRRSWGEADRLVTLFTREAGIMRVLAKGVRKIPSRRGGHLEPLTRVLAVVNNAHDWWYLAHVETQDYFEELQANTNSLEVAQRLGQLFLAVVQEGEANPDMFEFFSETWKVLPRVPFPKQVLLELGATMKILHIGGVQPSLKACQRCGRDKPTDAFILDSREGGWHCLLCHGGLLGTAVSLPPRLLAVLKYAAAHPEEAVRVRITDEEGIQLSRGLLGYTAPEEVLPAWSSPIYGYAAG